MESFMNCTGTLQRKGKTSKQPQSNAHRDRNDPGRIAGL